MSRDHLPDEHYEEGAEQLRRRFKQYKIPIRVRDVAEVIYNNPENTGAALNWLHNAVRIGLMREEQNGRYKSYYFAEE